MTEQEIDAIVSRVLAALHQTAAVPSASPPVLVLFSGAMLGFDDALRALGRLDDVELHWTQTPAAERVLDRERIDALGMTPASRHFVRSHELLVLPTLTVNLAAKIAHGIGDCLASNLAAEFIMSGRPVVAAVEGVCPDGPKTRDWFPQMPEAYRQMLRSTLGTMRDFGVRLTSARHLDRTVRDALGIPSTAKATGHSVRRRVVTEADVAALPDGARLPVGPHPIITDLARELADRRHIIFEAGS